MISSMFRTPLFRDKHIPYQFCYYSFSIAMSFLHFFSGSTRSKGKKNGTDTGGNVVHAF